MTLDEMKERHHSNCRRVKVTIALATNGGYVLSIAGEPMICPTLDDLTAAIRQHYQPADLYGLGVD